MLVELGLVEQRYQAVLEVLNDGAPVIDVARRYGVARQTVHDWLRRYAAEGLGGLADRSSRPLSCPHQMDPIVEARVVEMRRGHPGWGPRTILLWLERDGIEPLPGRTSVERCLVRHGLVNPEIGAELFISARTVEWHMRKVFNKLGVKSRKDLKAVLPGRGS